MISIVYGGVKYILVRNAIYCKSCKDTIETMKIHDYKECSCGSIGIDGGLYIGNRILGDLSNIESRRVYCAIIRNKKIWLPYFIFKDCFKINQK